MNSRGELDFVQFDFEWFFANIRISQLKNLQE